MDKTLLRAMTRFSHEPSLIVDPEGQILAANDAARRQMALSEGDDIAETLGLTHDSQAAIEDCGRATTDQRILLVTRDGQEIAAVGWRVSLTDRDLRLIALRLERAGEVRAQFSKLTCQSQSETARLRWLREQNYRLSAVNRGLVAKAERDPMTGFLTANAFRNRISRLIERKTRFGLIYLDMNGLKRINDTFGHVAGDAAIKSMATAIRDSVRKNDVVARQGGDEFGILVCNRVNHAGLKRLGHRVVIALARRSLSLVDERFDHARALSTAIGVATWPVDGDTVEEIEEAADRAMYRSKQTGTPVVFATHDTSKTELN